MEKLSDISLVTKVVMLHDRKSFDLLVKKYQSPIRGFFLRQTLGDAQLSDDLAQDTFVKAYTHLSGFRGTASFSTWLYRIALNTSINFANKNKFKRFLVDMETAVFSLFHRVSEEENALSKMEEEERKQAIKKAMDGLNEKQRTAFVLSKYEDLSQKQIAEIMQLSEGAVEQLLQRAKSNLRKKLAHLS